MSWLDKHTTIYHRHTDKVGQAVTIRAVIYWLFEKSLPAIIAIRRLNPDASDYVQLSKELKSQMSLWSPHAYLTQRTNFSDAIHTGLLQIDFDYKDIRDFDIEELKQCVFSLPFIAFCGLSCSGRGFYALAAISEPHRHREYAEHLFKVFAEYGITVDRSKGRNINDLRYMSYDANMLVREIPEPLKIVKFKTKSVQPQSRAAYDKPFSQQGPITRSNMVQNGIDQILSVQPGRRWETVQKVAFTLGGLRDQNLIQSLEYAIHNNPAFEGEVPKYLKCAHDCFRDGFQKPFTHN